MFVPDPHPIRQWADTFPWAALFEAFEPVQVLGTAELPHIDQGVRQHFHSKMPLLNVFKTEGIVKLIFPFPGSVLMWHTRRMNTPPPTNLYGRHRCPVEIISHCVWLYCRFCLRYRDVEELVAERGVILTCEAVQY